MKIFLSILLMLVLYFFTGCKENTKSDIAIEKKEPINPVKAATGQCAYVKTEKTIATAFPFNESTRIELVSYEVRQEANSNTDLIRNNKFIISPIRERITLNKEQTDSFFSILYNYISIGPEKSRADCYNPRHALVFYKNTVPIAFLEVCLECGGTAYSPQTDFGDFCGAKMCMLQKLFEKAGIKEGIIKEVCP